MCKKKKKGRLFVAHACFIFRITSGVAHYIPLESWVPKKVILCGKVLKAVSSCIERHPHPIEIKSHLKNPTMVMCLFSALTMPHSFIKRNVTLAF
jgi:hypothetical protein